MKYWLKLMVVVTVVSLVSCGGGKGPSQPDRQASFGSSSKGEGKKISYFMLPGGSNADQPAIESLVKAKLGDYVRHSGSIDFATIDPNQLNAADDPSRWGFQIGPYYGRISWEKHWVGCCINRDVWHLGFLLKRNIPPPEYEIFNVHLLVWWDNGPQFGIYNSANGWCRTTTGKFTSIRQAIYDYIRQTTSISPSYAWAVAGTAAVIVVIAFSLSWA